MSVFYNLKMTDQETLLDFLSRLSLSFESFNSSVTITSSALRRFIEILKDRKDCQDVQVRPYDDHGRTIIELTHYPEYYLHVKLKLLFVDRDDGTCYLCGFTRYAVDEDDTCMKRVEFPEKGVRLDPTTEIDDFFGGCTFVFNPIMKQVEYYE